MNGAVEPREAVLELTDVHKRFQVGSETVHALRGVDFTVRRGSVIAVVGPSGSGKSTLLTVAAGLDRPDEGRVELLGKDVASLDARDRARVRRQQVGFVFQFFHLVPTLTVAENVEIPLLIDRRSGDRQRVVELLDRVGLADRANHLPSQLSGGQMQRVAVARALVHDPAIVFADEPTGNLDSATGEAVLGLLIEQVRVNDASLVLVTHDSGVAARADGVVTMADGSIV